MLHRVILTAASVVALATAANAADMYRPSAGGYKDVPYVGVNWSGVYVGVNGGYGQNSNNSDMNGGFGGGQIGYNVQRGNLVFGVEGDIEGSSIKGTNTGEIDYFGSLRARAGYAFDRTLFYATGGYGSRHCGNCVAENVDGWVVGGGVEYKINPTWSVKGEYQYQDYSSSNVNEGLETFRVGVNYFVGGGYDPLK
jgi:outer membrane immunogenic protein